MSQNESSHRKPSRVEDHEETEPIIISGSMSTSEILSHLGRHGCNDVTSRLDTSKIGRAPILTGGSGDVYHGALRDGTQVGVKCLRLLIGIDDSIGKKQLTRTARELYVWSKCKHPNILELIGVAIFDNRVAMVSPWMENGNLNWYLRQNPNANHYHLCAQIAGACAYLKDCNVVHGDIKGANILISKEHVPKLTDFGSSATGECTLGFTSTTANLRTTLRWTAPEIFLEETKLTFEGDVYALGMTILEVFTGSVPYIGLLDAAVMRRLMDRAHPPRPEKDIPIGDKLSDLLWALITSCWEKDPRQRPSALQVQNALNALVEEHNRGHNNFLSPHIAPREVLRHLVTHGSRDVTDDIDRWSIQDERTVTEARSKKVVKQARLLSGALVALARIEVYEGVAFTGSTHSRDRDLRTAQEALILSQCSHPCICDIIGVALLDDKLITVFSISQHRWLRNVLQETTTRWGVRKSQLPRCKMSTQIADATAYLHSKDIVHGDISTDNILVSDDYKVELTGFYNACAKEPSLAFPRRTVGSYERPYHKAPELDSIRSKLTTELTFESDVYSLGATIENIITCDPSWDSWDTPEWQRHSHFSRSTLDIPKNSAHGDLLWSLLKECWVKQPGNRPLAIEVRDRMVTITDEGLEEYERDVVAPGGLRVYKSRP